jgi:hypothetical protein
MSELIIGFSPKHRPRAIHNDEHAGLLQSLGFSPPVRASHVEPIRFGSNAWKWMVDMSPLGEEYAFCLWPPFESRQAALDAEHDFILNNWVCQKH